MSDEKYYQRVSPLTISSSTNYNTEFGTIAGWNHQNSKNNTLSCLPSKDITKQNFSQNIVLKSSSPSIHRSQKKVPKPRNGLRMGKNMKRIELLSQPKFRVGNYGLKSTLTNSAITNQNDHGKIEKTNVDCSSASTSHRLRAVTPRLLRLAQPKIHATSNFNIKERCIEDSEKIEMAKVSKRLDELAQPKKLQFRTNKDPFKVNPQALEASCSTRVQELARPKGSSQPFPQLFQAYLDRAFVEP